MFNIIFNAVKMQFCLSFKNLILINYYGKLQYFFNAVKMQFSIFQYLILFDYYCQLLCFNIIF